jgi:type I restriction enzyme S subunit
LEEWEIPLPPPEAQDDLIAQIDGQQAVIMGAEMILSNWLVDALLDLNAPKLPFSQLAEVDGTTVKVRDELTSLPYISGENIESGTGRLLGVKSAEEFGVIGPSYRFAKGHVVYSKVRPALRKCFSAGFDGLCSADIYPLAVKSDRIEGEYLAMVMASKWFADQAAQFHGRAGMPKINRDQLAAIAIPVPNKDTQIALIRRFVEERTLLERLRREIAAIKAKISEILTNIRER